MRIFKSSPRLITGIFLALSIQSISILSALLLTATAGHAQASFLDSQIPVGSQTLSNPGGIATDGSGNLYIADTGNSRIVEITRSAAGYSAGTTLLTGLSSPAGIASDFYGNLYIADTGNNRIVELPLAGSTYGSLVTVASSGFNAPASVAVDSAGNLFVADAGNNRVVELPLVSGAFSSPVVIGSGFSNPQGVAVDSSKNVYVADTGNNRIIKDLYSANGYATQQIAVSRLNAPIAVAVDNALNVYIAQTGVQTILEEIWLAGAGRFNGSTIAGSGFLSPRGLATDSFGNLWVADAAMTQPWQVTASVLPFAATSVAAAGPVENFNFSITAGATIGSIGILAQGAPGLDFLDAGESTCVPQTYSAATICSVRVQFAPTGPGVRPGAVVLYDGAGNTLATAYISGTGSAARSVFFPATQTVVTSQLSNPSGVAVDGAGNLYIADTGNNRILQIPTSGGASASPIQLPVIQLNTPMGMAIDGAGNLYIASNGNDKIVKLARNAAAFAPQTKIGAAVYAPSAVLVDSAGDLFIADSYDNRILKLPWTGNGYTTPQIPGTDIRIPTGVGVDNTGNVYLSMPYQNKVTQVPLVGGKYQPNHNLSVNQISFPTAILCDGNSNLYILDTGNNRVVMLPWSPAGFGAQVTVATGFNAPAGMAIDPSGNLYVADTGNNQVVRINLAQPAPYAFASTYVGTTSSDSAQTMTLQNTGTLPLSVDTVAYPLDFPEAAGVASDCAGGDVLTAGTGCTFSIDFTPQSASAQLNEAVTVSSAAAGATPVQVSMAVSGSALSQQSQSIAFTPIVNVTYGTPAIPLHAITPSGLPVTYQVLSGPAVLVSGGKAISITGVGTVVVQAAQTGNSNFQAAAPATCSFTVSPAVLTVTPANTSAVYGSIPTVFTYNISGFVFGQSTAQVITGSPTITINGGRTAGVGSHALVATAGTLTAANYTFTFAPGAVTVTSATLQITPAAASMAYGGATPKFTWSAKGFVNGDAAAVVTGAPSLSTTANASSSIGAYPITASAGTLAAANYSFAFKSGTLTVGKATLTVTAQNQSMVCGGTAPALSYILSGFQGADTAQTAVQGAPAVTASASSRSIVGSYAIAPALGTLSSASYTFTFVKGTITVTPAPLTITPVAVTMTYGGAVPALKSWQAAGLLNGDSTGAALKGTPVLATAATSATTPGSAAITIAAGTLTATNYKLSFQPGTLTINKAKLTVQPAAASRIYGAANPAFTFTMSGFIGNDTAASVTGSPALTASATGTSPIGKYAITGTAGSLTSSNYAFTIAGGTLTVNRAPLTVAASALSVVYGNTTPALSYTVNGLVNSDTASVLTGTPALTTNAPAAPGVGSYSIAVSVSQVTAANYTISSTNAQLTVTKAVATITAASQTATVGSTLPTLTYTLSGLLGTDTASVVTGKPVLSTTATATSAAGTYPITVAAGTLAAKNYTFTLVNGTLTLSQAAAAVFSAQLPPRRIP